VKLRSLSRKNLFPIYIDAESGHRLTETNARRFSAVFDISGVV
jgi:hypothetical protein